MTDLFTANAQEYYRRNAPLAERMRPDMLAEFFGQEPLVGPGKFLRRMIEADQLKSLVLWGPPGTGKTTLAHIIANSTGRRFERITAVTAGVADIKEILKRARAALKYEKKATLLFIDEIHRFNKAQQDALLHAVEDGTIVMIGATTENPSFEINSALLSRLQVLVLEALDGAALEQILARALHNIERGLGLRKLEFADKAKEELLRLAAGDARALLNFLELAALLAEATQTEILTAELIREAAGRRMILYDAAGEEHYNLISAFIKSLRGSDADAAIYYLARMLEGGEDPLFIARRLVIFASEDVGNADPRALPLAVAAQQAVHFIGMPEGFYPLSQCALYLALASKSNAAGIAYMNALQAVKERGPLPTPLHIRNAPTQLMKNLGYGKAYQYPHEAPGALVGDAYLPDALAGSIYYAPTAHGFEKQLKDRYEELRAIKAKLAAAPKKGQGK